MEFGDRLKALRKARGLSQDELAALLHTTKQVISRYETGQREPRVSVAAQYARQLGVSVEQLVGPHAGCGPEETGGMRRIPIIGSVACGEPIYKPSGGGEYATIESGIACDFALVAQGDSMTGDRIHSGDLVFIRRQSSVRDGEIAAVALDDELTLKRVRRILGPNGCVAFTQLLPSNPRYAPINIGGEGETRCVSILGKAVAVRFSL